MPLAFPDEPYARRHAPKYTTYESYKPWLRDEFQFRCVYCMERERWYPSGAASFGADHVKPKGDPDYADLECEYENLVYACNRCNSRKLQRIFVDPCQESLAEHILFKKDGTAVALTVEGMDLISILELDKLEAFETRQSALRIYNLYKQLPDNPDVRDEHLYVFGYPSDLPDLQILHGKNQNKGSESTSYFARKNDGLLDETY